MMCIIEFSIHNNTANNNERTKSLDESVLFGGQANVTRANQAQITWFEKIGPSQTYCNMFVYIYSACRIWWGESEIRQKKNNVQALVTTAHNAMDAIHATNSIFLCIWLLHSHTSTLAQDRIHAASI